MRATAWNSGNTYGVRVGFPNRDQFFDRSWCEIEVEIEDEWHRFTLTAGFWNHCPEFRSPIIREWFARHQLLNWPRGNPPDPLGGNRFRLTRE